MKIQLKAWSTAVCAFLLCAPALANIKNPSDHPAYGVELEPHLVADFSGDDQLGLGLRASFEIVDPGFVPSISNTVALGVGFDYLFDDDEDYCVNGRCWDDDDTLHIPLVLQWNFWFTPKWSAFAEPGLMIQFRDDDDFDGDFDGDDDDVDLDLGLYLGGRYNFNPSTALTLRIGSPVDLTLGISFLL